MHLLVPKNCVPSHKVLVKDNIHKHCGMFVIQTQEDSNINIIPMLNQYRLPEEVLAEYLMIFPRALRLMRSEMFVSNICSLHRLNWSK